MPMTQKLTHSELIDLPNELLIIIFKRVIQMKEHERELEIQLNVQKKP
jgi:hypothetical protein